MPDTHIVTNQVPPLENYNPATFPALAEALIREGGEWGVDEVHEVGALGGSRAKDTPLAHFYHRLLQRQKPPMVALIAAARKILVWAFAVFESGRPFDPALASSKAH